MPFERVQPSQIRVFPLSERRNDVRIEEAAAQAERPVTLTGRLNEQVTELARRMKAARERKAAVMAVYGAHLIKNGAGPLVNRLIGAGWLTHVGTQGAGTIHDWEFAWQGESSEDVRENTTQGRFGLWDETGRWINLAVAAGAAKDMGYGEAMGKFIAEEGLDLPAPAQLIEQIRHDLESPLTGARADLLQLMRQAGIQGGRIGVKHPFKRFSVLAKAFESRIPFTVHPGIGYDIFTNHPLFSGAAIGRASGADARLFAQSVLNLSGGVYLSIGSAIMSPQVFEKAVSLANNIRLQGGQPPLKGHTIAIVDIQEDGNWDWSQGEPPNRHPAYYLRFCKSFYRMGGEVMYLRGDNREVINGLLQCLGA